MSRTVHQQMLAVQRDPLGHMLDSALTECGVPHGARVVLAVSGGADSMALLALAAGLAERGRISPVAAHVDHGLRAESAAEGAAVARQAKALGVPVVRARLALRRGGNLSARARSERYRALLAAARESEAPWVLTAHHADDQFETMIMALGRGAGLARVAGMRPVRTLGPGVKLVRPLLGVARRELRALCVRLEIEWCDDPTNADTTRPRGAVRHGVVPQLERLWPGAAGRSQRTAALLQWACRHLRRSARALEQESATEHGLKRHVLRRAALPVVATVVQRMVGRACTAELAWNVARAVKDSTVRPRRWQARPTHEVRLTARYLAVSSVGGTTMGAASAGTASLAMRHRS